MKKISTRYGEATIDQAAFERYQQIVEPIATLTHQQLVSKAYHAIRLRVCRALIKEFTQPHYSSRHWLYGSYWSGTSIGDMVADAQRRAEYSQSLLLEQLHTM